ncbi:MAG: hypothetical protein HY432_02940 [Candidatus Liptonbacteria bacterium]|nr:hypothetical protein [Candidatus Liptonbacteria bacterium]
MLGAIDNFLNRITMYRLVLYYLIFLLAAAAIFGYFGILPYGPIEIAFSAAVLAAISWITNVIFARVFCAQPNVESVYITAFILTLIITPTSPGNINEILFLLMAGFVAMASKYILAVNKKHIFNPAAFAVVFTAITMDQFASWWVGGNLPMMSFVVAGGLLVVRKVQRFDMVSGFFVVALLVTATAVPAHAAFSSIQRTILYTPIFFFAFVMLTEPITTPPTRFLRIIYGALVGFLFASPIPLVGIYSTLEFVLLVGNIFSYAVSPKKKYIFQLARKELVGTGIYDFVFETEDKVKFKPGQYLEWTLGHEKPDTRGNRRYFTIASSPTEKEVRLGIKFYESPSTFKKKLASLESGSKIIAGQLSGDFVLPRNKDKKLAFLAGGIGVTPFRSIVKYLLDKNEQRQITLLYSSKNPSEIAYRNIFREAEEKLGMKIVYALSGDKEILADKNARIGIVNREMIEKEIPDYKERTFYVSGPHSMVEAMKKVLLEMGVGRIRIKTDFFPGYA